MIKFQRDRGDWSWYTNDIFAETYFAGIEAVYCNQK